MSTERCMWKQKGISINPKQQKRVPRLLCTSGQCLQPQKSIYRAEIDYAWTFDLKPRSSSSSHSMFHALLGKENVASAVHLKHLLVVHKLHRDIPHPQQLFLGLEGPFSFPSGKLKDQKNDPQWNGPWAATFPAFKAIPNSYRTPAALNLWEYHWLLNGFGCCIQKSAPSTET